MSIIEKRGTGNNMQTIKKINKTVKTNERSWGKIDWLRTKNPSKRIPSTSIICQSVIELISSAMNNENCRNVVEVNCEGLTLATQSPGGKSKEAEILRKDKTLPTWMFGWGYLMDPKRKTRLWLFKWFVDEKAKGNNKEYEVSIVYPDFLTPSPNI